MVLLFPYSGPLDSVPLRHRSQGLPSCVPYGTCCAVRDSGSPAQSPFHLTTTWLIAMPYLFGLPHPFGLYPMCTDGEVLNAVLCTPLYPPTCSHGISTFGTLRMGITSRLSQDPSSESCRVVEVWLSEDHNQFQMDSMVFQLWTSWCIS